jgi:carboxymethylenebutenolidase
MATTAPTADEQVELRVSDGTRMLAYVARPPHPVSASPGIIVLQEAYGVNGYLRDVTARLANELGCIAIAPELYHRTGDGAVGSYDFDPPKMKEHRAGLSIDGQAADVVAAFEWLRAQGVPANKTAALGFCMGGRVAFLGNASVPLRSRSTAGALHRIGRSTRLNSTVPSSASGPDSIRTFHPVNGEPLRTH